MACRRGSVNEDACRRANGGSHLGSGITGWGYEGRTVADLVEFTRAMGAEWIVDVRLTPLSRKPGFSKRSLAAALTEAGIQYLHLPALGNPRDNRAGFADANGPRGEAARAHYVSEVLTTDAAAEALDQVRALGANDGVVLVCFEADGRCCHRTEVLHALDAARLAA